MTDDELRQMAEANREARDDKALIWYVVVALGGIVAAFIIAEIAKALAGMGI